MNLKKTKKQLLSKLPAIGTTLTLIAIKSNMCFATSTDATSGIGTAEVKTATENIERVITSIAMPLGRSSYLCKYCYCSN